MSLAITLAPPAKAESVAIPYAAPMSRAGPGAAGANVVNASEYGSNALVI